MYGLVSELYPINRSITGGGARETFSILKREMDLLEIKEIPSGTKCYDWTVPDEWRVGDAYVMDPTGKKILDFKDCNLRLVGYSVPFKGVLSLSELQKHLYSLPEQPDLIPYVTSYYSPKWGFCLSQKERDSLIPGEYRVVVDTGFSKGSMTYGEAFLPGDENREILLSTYTCHPSLANDNLSGPALAVALYRWLVSRPRRFSYRFVFAPETIGSIAYISLNLDRLKTRTLGGFVLTCVGDDRAVSFMPSRKGDSAVDSMSRHILAHMEPDFKEYSFLDRGSDERQYCSPGVDLPMASIMRSKYGSYPEYHTSGDNLSLVSPRGLGRSFEIYARCLSGLESNRTYKMRFPCEPKLDRLGYHALSIKGKWSDDRLLLNLSAYMDGKTDLLGLSEKFGLCIHDLIPYVEAFIEKGLVMECDKGQ